MLKLYPIHSNLIDIFQGDGWESWTRIKKISGQWKIIRGLMISEALLKLITKDLK